MKKTTKKKTNKKPTVAPLGNLIENFEVVSVIRGDFVPVKRISFDFLVENEKDWISLKGFPAMHARFVQEFGFNMVINQSNDVAESGCVADHMIIKEKKK